VHDSDTTGGSRPFPRPAIFERPCTNLTFKRSMAGRPAFYCER
jgi:hypothetical protein